MRYRTENELKNSGIEWIEKIPSSWELSRIKNVAKIDPEILSEKANSDLEFDYVDIGSVNQIGKIINLESLIFQNAPSRARKKVRFLDIIVSSVRTYLKAIAIIIFSFEKPIIVSTGFTVLRAQKVDPVFLYYWTRSNFMISEIVSRSTGVSYPAITSGEIGKLPVLSVSLPEQRAIATFLDRKTEAIEALIQKKEQLIEKLKEKRQALITRAVTKGLNTDVPMKDSGIEWLGEIPEHWDIIKLKYAGDLYGRIGFRGYTVDDIVNEEEGAISLSPSNIKDDELLLNENTYLSWEKYYESPEIMVYPHDIIIVKTGSTIGKTAYIPTGVPKMTLNPQLVVLKNIKMFSKYLFYQTTCGFIKNLFKIEQAGGSTPSLSQEKIRSFKVIYIKSIAEQKEIVNYLEEKSETINVAIKKNKQQIDRLKEYRQSLISAAVTGKIDVREEVSV